MAGAVSMLPAALAAGPCSLVAGRSCCTLSLSAVLGPSGAVEQRSVAPATVLPRRRLTYEEANAQLAQPASQSCEPALHLMLQVR